MIRESWIDHSRPGKARIAADMNLTQFCRPYFSARTARGYTKPPLLYSMVSELP